MKKFILSIVIALLTGSFAIGQNYLNENFDGTWSGTPGVPAGWSNIHTTAIPGTPGTGTDPVYWAQNTWSGTAWSSAGASVPTLPAGAYSNSSVAWYKNGTALATQKDQLTTPAINLSTSSYSVITFYLACGVNQPLDVYKYSLKIRGFDGSTWSDIQTISKTGTDWTKIMVPVPAVYNVAGAKFGIEITADNKFNIDIWIDDFRIDEVAAPLSGTKTIGVDYASVALAIKALNESGISGPVTINVPGGYTETFVSRHDGLITATGTAANPIIFQKSGGGANPVITAGTGATTTLDGIIKIAGGDYITFDGIDLSENSLNTTQTTRMEFGYALLKASNIAPFNGCQNVVIKSCTITLNKATTCTGIYAGNHLPSSSPSIDLTGGNTSDAMNNCQFYSNTVTNVTNGIALQGWSAPAPYDMFNQNIEIGVGGANTITDFNTNGINPRYMKGLKVANNSISSSTLTPNNLAGITVLNTTHYDIYSNTITLTPAAMNSGITGISVQSGDAGYTSNIYSNTVQNCTNATATSGAFTGITVSSSLGILNFYSNTVNNNSIPGTGGFTGMSISGGNTNIYNNTVSNNTKTGISGLFTCMALTGVTSNNLHDNFIFSNSNTTTGTTTGGAIYGIACTSSSTLAANIYKNRIYNLSATGAAGIVNGIYCNASSAGLNVYNNFISDLRTPTAHSATKVNAIAGIYVNGGTTVYAFYNTVYLNASSTGASLYSAALYASTTPAVDLRNNIFVNVSTSGSASTGVAAAHRRSSVVAGLPSYSGNSNANVFYTGTEDASHTTYYDGTTLYNFAGYQTLVGPVRDAGSFYELPPFINVASTPYDLHINITPATSCESGGVQVTSPLAIADDFDGNPRSTVPDIGADEFAGIAMGVINPGGLNTTLISSSQIDVAFTSNPSTDNVVIVWNNTGVFITPTGIPPTVTNAFAGGTLLYNGPTATVNHTGLTGATTYYYKAFSYTGSAYSLGVTVSNITNIAAPTALTAVTIDNTQINLAWTKNAFNNDVIIANNTSTTFGQPVNGTAYVANDPIIGGGTIIYVGPLNAFNNTGLSGATTYSYKAWSVDALNNNVYSPTGTTASALTWCNPSVLPYSEGFEGGSLGCGSTLDVAADGSTTWAFYYGPSQAHNSTASIRIGTPSMAPSNDWYFTNWLQLTAGVTYELKFWWKNTTTANVPHQLEIKYGNAPSVAGMSSPAIYSNTNLNINNTWTEVSCTFTPSVSGNIYIGFHNTTPVPPATSPYFYIDDIAVAVAPPTAYAITGGGSYCQGAGGLPVGLANSETGVTYTLYLGGVAQVPTVAGTGSAITFGNQLAGTYTVSGTGPGGTTSMAGSAVIIETPLVTPAFTQLGPYPQGATPEVLPGTSVNGITGTWDPAVINTFVIGDLTYTFTPDAGQCATIAAMVVATVSPQVSFNVDMSTAAGFIPGTDLVYMAGNFPGATWNEPGTNPALLMSQVGTTLTYTLTLALPNGTYEYKYFKNAGWSGGEYAGGSNRSVIVAANTTAYDTWGGSINWANLQWPASGTVTIGGDFDVYAQAYIQNGVTAAAGNTTGLQAWIGYSTSNSDPSTWTNWVPAAFNSQAFDNDEFKANLVTAITETGTYYYASRFQYGSMPYVYGGFNSGYWDGTTNVSGVLTVDPPATKTLTVKAYIQGFWNGTSMNQVQDADMDLNTFNKFTGTTVDTLSVLLAESNSPWGYIFQAHTVNINPEGTMSVTVPSSFSGSYYIVIKQRNTVETWSANAVSFNGATIAYDFTTSASQAFGSNQYDLNGDGSVWGLYSGDFTSSATGVKDEYVDFFDLNEIFNLNLISAFGFQSADITGDGFVDFFDVNMAYNNNLISVGMNTPPNPAKRPNAGGTSLSR